MNKTTVITDIANLSITVNGNHLPTRMVRDMPVSRLTNSQVRELGIDPPPSSAYDLFNGILLRQIRGGNESHRLDLPILIPNAHTAHPHGCGSIITSELTPVPQPPQKQQKPRPRRPRTGPPVKRGPAAKFVPLFAACEALIDAAPWDGDENDVTVGWSIIDAIITGLAIAKRVAGED